MDKLPSFHLPTKPYSLIDAINRNALATGSIHYAMAGAGANYNGHRNHLSWNDYRQYYVGEFTWAGRNVFYRGTDFIDALRISFGEYAAQGLGASLVVYPHTESDVALCHNYTLAIKDKQYKLIEGQEDYAKLEWVTWRHKMVNTLVGDMRRGVPAFQIVEKSNSEQEYFENVREHFKERDNRNVAAILG